jgi:aryl-alcohol dehydrogenase-like predicted oxidoreductase
MGRRSAVGAATVEHLRANLGGLAVVLKDDDRAALATLAESPAGYWHRRGRLAWS